MKIAYTMAPARGDTDRLLFAVAEDLAASGYRTCGTVQINTDRGEQPCDMDVRVLPDGPVLRISQSLGRGARGCRLDPASLETAVGLVEAGLNHGADIVIVNKFGKHEAEGRGFRTIIAAAIARDIPVLVGVNALNLDAFLAFVGAEATRLEPSKDTLARWLDTAMATTGEAA
ncbi:DUF2478 domain-containing protein [Oceaniglobus indicus]|uniref:DUF2478 domain-containing protein n=1 Tax=Oceaniglobus indicus TaxID=2047749 RepID=UPI000C1A1DF0|nr:DUF2478 domain-containing protein [Oceaniglobus indicus]